MLALAFALGALAAGWPLAWYAHNHPVKVTVWHRTDTDGPPPEGEPVMAFWIRSGTLDYALTRRVDSRYFEYKDAPLSSAAFFGFLPPVWWIEAPGQAVGE